MKTEPTAFQYDSHLTSDQSAWDDISRYVTSLTSEPDFVQRTEAPSKDKYSAEYADELARFADEKLAQQEN